MYASPFQLLTPHTLNVARSEPLTWQTTHVLASLGKVWMKRWRGVWIFLKTLSLVWTQTQDLWYKRHENTPLWDILQKNKEKKKKMSTQILYKYSQINIMAGFGILGWYFFFTFKDIIIFSHFHLCCYYCKVSHHHHCCPKKDDVFFPPADLMIFSHYL